VYADETRESRSLSGWKEKSLIVATQVGLKYSSDGPACHSLLRRLSLHIRQNYYYYYSSNFPGLYAQQAITTTYSTAYTKEWWTTFRQIHPRGFRTIHLLNDTSPHEDAPIFATKSFVHLMRSIAPNSLLCDYTQTNNKCIIVIIGLSLSYYYPSPPLTQVPRTIYID